MSRPPHKPPSPTSPTAPSRHIQFNTLNSSSHAASSNHAQPQASTSRNGHTNPPRTHHRVPMIFDMDMSDGSSSQSSNSSSRVHSLKSGASEHDAPRCVNCGRVVDEQNMSGSSDMLCPCCRGETEEHPRTLLPVSSTGRTADGALDPSGGTAFNTSLFYDSEQWLVGSYDRVNQSVSRMLENSSAGTSSTNDDFHVGSPRRSYRLPQLFRQYHERRARSSSERPTSAEPHRDPSTASDRRL